MNIVIIQKGYNKFIAYDSDIYSNSGADWMATLRDELNEIAIWCKDITGNDYETWNIDHTGSIFTFDNDADAALFKLTWC